MASERSRAVEPSSRCEAPQPSRHPDAPDVPIPEHARELRDAQMAGGNAATVRLLRDVGAIDASAEDAPQSDMDLARRIRARIAAPAEGELTIARQVADGGGGAPGTQGAPQRPSGLPRPSLSDAETELLRRATGGAGIVETIRRRDEARAAMAELGQPTATGGGMPEGSWHDEYARLEALDHGLTAEIDAQLAELGVADERELLALVEDRFPEFFLSQAKQVALEMLDHNEAEARGELDRYSAQVCSPDIEGLIAADHALDELDPAPLENSVRAAEEALARYRPSAGVPSDEELAAMIPQNQRSVMVDIANLERNRAMLEQRRAIYDSARYSYGRRYPILLAADYRPGGYAAAPREQLGQLVGEPITNVLENIERVRDAINDDDLKVWQLRDVLRITQERLAVRHPVLLAAVETRIAAVQRDEQFMAWVIAALAISTSVLAGLVFTPAAGVAVAAAWGVGALAGSIDEYRDESAAENVALDAAVADLSLNEPTIAWILLDAMFLCLDLAAVAKAMRPAARLLTANRDAVALQVFRREANARFGEESAEALTRRAAVRHGIQETGQRIAEEQLAHARTVLAGLNLSDDAIARILAKGTDVNQIKGQLFEEMMHADVARRLASGGDATLGVADSAGLELLPGHRISDLAGRQLTDGMIVRRLPDGSIEIVTVLEAKAGRTAAQGLRSASEGIGDPQEFARVVIEGDRAAVVRALRRAGLAADADAVAAGGERLSDAAVDAVAADRGLRRLVTQAEVGGQVRRDVERLAPNVGDVEGAASHLDEVPTQILVDGVPTAVRMSPTRTRFVGAVPQDVPTGAITESLQREGLSFSSLAIGEQAADLTARAQRLAAHAAAAAPATAPATAPAP